MKADFKIGIGATIANQHDVALYFELVNGVKQLKGTLDLKTAQHGLLEFKVVLASGYYAFTFDAGSGLNIALKDLAGLFLAADHLKKVPDLSFDIKRVFLLYKKATPPSDSPVFAIGVDLSIQPIDLAKKLDVVGPMLPEGTELAIKDLMIAYSTTALKKENGNDKIKVILDEIGMTELEKGGNLGGEIQLGKMVLPLGQKQQKKTAREPEIKRPSQPETGLPDPPEDKPFDKPTKWEPINKYLGPVSLQKLGLKWENGFLKLIIDASIAGAGLEANLIGLEAGVEVGKWKHWTFGLAGLGFGIEKGPVEISGSLLKVNDHTALHFTGTLRVRFQDLVVSAIADFQRLKKTDTTKEYDSLFAYAVIEYPLGGPPAFFVTGGALGFGYNRDLKIPKLQEVGQFPLIEWAMDPKKMRGKNISEILTKVEAFSPPAPELYWLALGVRFTSFGQVEGVALITVSIGTDVEINLLGSATLQIPHKNPLVQVNLDLKASYSPKEGKVAIEAMLRDSFLFSKDCTLSGGLSFYTWLTGEHEGDFVFTLGGYHPDFNIPTHYPKPGRVALNWNVNSNLSLAGNAYFAVTPGFIMAGLEVMLSFQASWWLKLGMKLYAHLLIRFLPFHFHFKGGVSLFVEIKIGTKDYHYTKKQTLFAVDLELWGPDPELCGYLKAEFIKTFTIEFGQAPKHAKPISWEEFKAQSLQKGDGKVLDLSLSQGLVKDLRQENKNPKATDPDWVIDPHDFRLKVLTKVPVKEAKLGKKQANLEPIKRKQAGRKNGSKKVGVRPAGISPDKFKSGLEIKTDLAANLTVEPIYSNVPAGLWGKPSEPDLKEKGAVIKDVITGYVLRPSPSKINIESLVLKRGAPDDTHVHWKTLNYTRPEITYQTCDQEKPFTDTISHANTRNKTLAALKKARSFPGLEHLAKNLSINKKQAGLYWPVKPVICDLGHKINPIAS